ncbi:MAG: tRNA uridine-5-carboxymethylaminomethyl(34) synthesis GTPase MnmE [Clostridiales bacterium]|nr:tRNA uridine-5-carboxymethylaminomethyl(34) synthesis GTPase MnmE [Clostridiales bacterium]
MINDTIVAIATGTYESAIGIIRMSGDESIKIIGEVFKPKENKKFVDFGDRNLVYGHIYDGNKVIDEVFTVYMKAPRTYTREDVVEINCHGGIIPLNEILKLLIKKGARMAEPGEFTKRAFLCGRLDLAQAEAVMDLISAKTPKGFDVAFNQLEGKLSKKVKIMRNKISTIMASIEVGIDYPEEDIEDVTYDEINNYLKSIKDELEELIKNSQTGKILRDGLNTVIVGKPNVGKSSLMNALLKESRSIVTDIPGTTRDIIEEHINIMGIPIKIIDTAGIRKTEDIIEKMGVEKSKEYFNSADLILLVLNAAEKLTEDDIEIIDLIKNRNTIVLINKTDLPQVIDMNIINSHIDSDIIIKGSITLEHGLDELENKIYEMVYGAKIKKTNENPMISNIRHITALEKAYEQTIDALKATNDKMPYDFIEIDIKNVYEYLGEISGDTIEQDVVSKIFSKFCLGK